MDLKLPEIEPARVIPSAADAIDRAGAKFKQAADSVGEALLKPELAQVAVETQEATLQSVRGLNDILHLAKSSPEMSLERVNTIFGGKIPKSIQTTEERTLSGGSTVTAEREIIPTHEVVEALFEQQSKVVVDNAAANIKAPGWQKKFREAAAMDVEKARAEALDWQRTQRAADVELRTLAQLQQAENSRAWDLYESILSNGDLTLKTPGLRAKLLGELPMKRTLAGIADRLHTSDVGEIDKLAADLKANKFEAPLPVEQQDVLYRRALDVKASILAEQERQAKAAEEREFLGVVSKAHAAALEAGKQGAPGTAVMSLDEIPILMSNGKPMPPERYATISRILTADPQRGTDMRYYGVLSQVLHTPGRLGRMSFEQLSSLTQHLSAAEEREWQAKWAKDKEDAGSVKPPLPEHYYGAIKQGVLVAMGGHPENDPQRAAMLEARAERALVNSRKANPRELLRDDIIAAVGEVAAGAKTGWFASKPPTEAVIVIQRQAGRAGVKVTDSYIASEWENIRRLKSDAQEAWDQAGGDGDVPLRVLADVYYKTNDPAKVEKLKAGVQARRAAEGYGGARAGPITDRDVMVQAVLEDVGPETAKLRQEREAEAEKKVTRRQLADRRMKLESQADALMKAPPPELKAAFAAIDKKNGVTVDASGVAQWRNWAGEWTDMSAPGAVMPGWDEKRQAALEYADRQQSAGFMVPAHKKGK